MIIVVSLTATHFFHSRDQQVPSKYNSRVRGISTFSLYVKYDKPFIEYEKIYNSNSL